MRSRRETSWFEALRSCDDGNARAPSDQLTVRRSAMNSPVIKRSVVIAGHKTSVSLEDAFWTSLKEIAISRGVALSDLVPSSDVERQQSNLSSCLRLFVLDFYRYQLIKLIGTSDAAPDSTAMGAAKS